MNTTDIQPFDFNGTNVRVQVDGHGEPWFALADLISILGMSSRPAQVAQRLGDDEKGVRQTDTPGGSQPITYVNESGMWKVILRSDSPAAEPVQRWVTRDVLPAIRRTGSYGVAPALTEAEIVAQALQITTRKVAELTPKAEAFDAFLSTSGDYSVRDAAHVLSRHHDILTGETRLRTWMLANGWLYRDATTKPRAYQRHIDAGRLAERAQWHFHPETGEKVSDTPQVRITAKGIDALAKALTKVTDQGELDVQESA